MLGNGNCPNARNDIYETRSRKENALERQMKRRLRQGNNKTELKKHKKGRKVVCKREGFNVGWCFDWEYRIVLSSNGLIRALRPVLSVTFRASKGNILVEGGN
jgi:hypothetical protein